MRDRGRGMGVQDTHLFRTHTLLRTQARTHACVNREDVGVQYCMVCVCVCVCV